MKNGPCPECNSTQVYYASSANAQGLRDEHSIHVIVDDLKWMYLDTYICANCGYVRSFLIPKDLPRFTAGVGKSKTWKKVE
jgi:hypothetical protein